MMRASDIAAMLANQAETVAAMLLPGGKREGHEWRAGSTGGEHGKSLGVRLTGNKAGIWADFSGSESGDLLDLWCATRNLTMAQAIAEAKDFLGVRDNRIENRPRTYSKPTREGVSSLPPQMAEWLSSVRKIGAETVKRYKLAARKGALMFPYLRDGELIAAKYRKVPAKEFWTDSDCEPCLFGWHALTGRERGVVLCEGEMDALAFAEYGIPALSVPFGGGKGNKQIPWIEAEFDRLAQFDTLFLAMDADGPGRAATAEIVHRLGRERCRIVTLPHKDANECLMQGVPRETVVKALEDAKTQDPEQLIQAAEFADELVREFAIKTGTESGVRLPWNKAQDSVILREGEVSLWLGVNGHGKALCLDTEIPTPDGWVRMGDIRPGDAVFDERGAPCNVVWESPVQHGRPCYRVTFSDGSSIIADAAHEWVTETAAGRQYRKPAQTVTTEQIAETLRGPAGRGRLANHSIRVAGGLQLPDADLPIAPYVFGAWLGDGTSTDSGITCNDPEIIATIESHGFPCTKSASRMRYGIGGGLYRLLRMNGLLGNKHIPSIYLRASDRQRLDLLRGLMDTDGHVTTYGRCEFTSMKSHLAESVRELVLSLGWQAQIVTGEARIKGKDCGTKYRVTFTPDRDVFNLKRKSERRALAITDRAKRRYIVGCEPVDSVPVKCIEVDSANHLYLASRAMIPTHNSQGMGQITLGALDQDVRCCVASMEFKPVKWLKRMVRQATALEQPSPAYVRHVAHWFRDKLWVFNVAGAAKVGVILEVFAYAARRYGITFFLIDNLAKCGFAEDDYSGQKAFADRLTDFARDYGVHVALVHHMRKGESEDKPGGKLDSKGSGGIADMVDTCAVWWRNKPKEKAIKAARLAQKEPDPDIARKPDGLLIFDKQRNGEEEPTFALWFDQGSCQFLGHDGQRPRQFVGFSSVGGAA